MSIKKQAISGTLMIGGAQVINALLSIVRTKIVALILGTAGLGLVGYWSTTKNLITIIGSMGLGTAGIREITGAEESRRTVSQVSLRIYSTALAILTIVATLVLGPIFSKMLGLEVLSTSILIFLGGCSAFSIMFSAFSVELRALGKVRAVAATTIIGSALATGIAGGVAIGRPELLKYSYILVPAILPAVISLIYLRINTGFIASRISISDFRYYAKSFFNFGIPVMLSSLVAGVAMFIVRSTILTKGGLELLGIFVAISMISERLLDAFMKTLTSEFYPRLTSAVRNPNQTETKMVIDTQIILTGRMGATIIIVCVLLSSYILNILFSNEFIFAAAALQIYLAADLFKLYGFPFGLVTLASGRSNISLLKESFINLTFLALVFFAPADPASLSTAYFSMRVINFLADLYFAKLLVGYTIDITHLVELAVPAFAILALILAGAPGVVLNSLLLIAFCYFSLQTYRFFRKGNP